MIIEINSIFFILSFHFMNSTYGNVSDESFSIHLNPGQSAGTSWRKKYKDSSVYLNLLDSSFSGTVNVSIYGRNPGSSEENCTNRVQSFSLRSNNKYFLFNLVHEKHFSEARILFTSNETIDIHGKWSPDSAPESGCIEITGREGNHIQPTIANNNNNNNNNRGGSNAYDRSFTIGAGQQRGRTSTERKLDSTSIYLNLQNCHFSGSAKVYIMGQNQGGRPQNCTNRGDYFLVESGKKYMMFNTVNESHFSSVFLEFEKPNANDVISGLWSPDSVPESGCIEIRSSSSSSSSSSSPSSKYGDVSDESFSIHLNPGQSAGTSWRKKYKDSSVYLNLLDSSFSGTVNVSIYGRNPGSSEENCTNRVQSFSLRSNNKYFLFNLVHEKHFSEARILFTSNETIDIHGKWSPDSAPESGCIEITGHNGSSCSPVSHRKIKIPHESSDKAKFLLKVPYLSQEGIPAGCEGVSATMLLNYFGFNISKEDFINRFLPKANWTCQSAPDPDEAFIGNPYISSGNNCGFGCYAGCIVKAINSFIRVNGGFDFCAKKIVGKSIDFLIENYVILRKEPVLIWATMNMAPSSTNGTQTWTLNNGPKKGSKFTWIAGEHCLVLVGFNIRSYFFNDPYKSNGVIGFRKDVVIRRYNELGKQAVILSKEKSVFEISNEEMIKCFNDILSIFGISQKILSFKNEVHFINPVMYGTITASSDQTLSFEDSKNMIAKIDDGKLSFVTKSTNILGDSIINITRDKLNFKFSNFNSSIDLDTSFDFKQKLDQIALTVKCGCVSFGLDLNGFYTLTINCSKPIVNDNPHVKLQITHH